MAERLRRQPRKLFPEGAQVQILPAAIIFTFYCERGWRDVRGRRRGARDGAVGCGRCDHFYFFFAVKLEVVAGRLGGDVEGRGTAPSAASSGRT